MGWLSSSLVWLIKFHKSQHLFSYLMLLSAVPLLLGSVLLAMAPHFRLLDMLLSLVDILQAILCVTNPFSFFVSQPTLKSYRATLSCYYFALIHYTIIYNYFILEERFPSISNDFLIFVSIMRDRYSMC